MREVTPALIDQASLIIVDSVSACQEEAGELVSTPTDRLVELGDLCRRGDIYQRLPDRWTVFKCVGVGVQDVAIARLVVSKAETRNLGTLVPFE
jgi:ornithine cyclodeaminase/alanine dehydrogenase-like protein (mu-crystallin family)